MIFEIGNQINFGLTRIERNIISYISSSGKIIIKNPKLPVKVTPVFASIAIHIMCDGSKSANKFFYSQKRYSELERFIKLIKYVFGNYETNSKRGHYVPAIFTTVVSQYYKIDNFLSSECRIPKKILNGDKNFKVAALLSFLHDDGNVSASVRFLSSNRYFLLDLFNLVKSLDYGCNNLSTMKKRFKMKKDGYSFTLKPSGVNNFFNDSRILIKEFPLMDVGRKLSYMESYVGFRNRKWKQRKKFETKEMIKNALKDEPKTAYELRNIINVTLWTTYHHLQHLMNKNEIKKIKHDKRYKYYLVNHQ